MAKLASQFFLVYDNIDKITENDNITFKSSTGVR